MYLFKIFKSIHFVFPQYTFEIDLKFQHDNIFSFGSHCMIKAFLNINQKISIMAATNKWIIPVTYPKQRQAWKLQTGWASWWKLQTSRTVRWIIMFSQDCLNSKISKTTVSTTCMSLTQKKSHCFSSFKHDRWREREWLWNSFIEAI